MEEKTNQDYYNTTGKKVGHFFIGFISNIIIATGHFFLYFPLVEIFDVWTAAGRAKCEDGPRDSLIEDESDLICFLMISTSSLKYRTSVSSNPAELFIYCDNSGLGN